jgi:hypothetical protein
VSFDIVVQGFRDGDARDTDGDALRAALAPYLTGSSPNSWNLRAEDSTAEIYGVDDLATGFMVTHVSGEKLWDVLVDIAAAFDLVILPAGVGTAMTRPEQHAHLPPELRADAFLVGSGAELLARIRAS